MPVLFSRHFKQRLDPSGALVSSGVEVLHRGAFRPPDGGAELWLRGGGVKQHSERLPQIMAPDHFGVSTGGDPLPLRFVAKEIVSLGQQLPLVTERNVVYVFTEKLILPISQTLGQQQRAAGQCLKESEIEVVVDRKVHHDFRARVDARDFLLKVVALRVYAVPACQLCEQPAALAVGSEKLADEANIQIALDLQIAEEFSVAGIGKPMHGARRVVGEVRSIVALVQEHMIEEARQFSAEPEIAMHVANDSGRGNWSLIEPARNQTVGLDVEEQMGFSKPPDKLVKRYVCRVPTNQSAPAPRRTGGGIELTDLVTQPP